MFVAAGRKRRPLAPGRALSKTVAPLVEEADKLRIPTEEVIEMIKRVKGGNNYGL